MAVPKKYFGKNKLQDCISMLFLIRSLFINCKGNGVFRNNVGFSILKGRSWLWLFKGSMPTTCTKKKKSSGFCFFWKSKIVSNLPWSWSWELIFSDLEVLMSTSYPESISPKLQLCFEIELNKEQDQIEQLRVGVQVVGMEPLKHLCLNGM